MSENKPTQTSSEPRPLTDEENKHLISQECDKALDFFERMIKEHPADRDSLLIAFVGGGRTLRKLRQFDKAEDMFKKASALNVGWRRLFIERGWLHFYRKQYQQAFADFEKALEGAGEDEGQRARVGLLASSHALDVESGNKENATKLMAKWRANNLSVEKAVSVFRNCTEIFERLNRYPGALNNVEQRLEIDKENPEAWCDKISALKWLRRYKEAEETYVTAQAKWPTDRKVWTEKANLLYEEKRFREAYQYYSAEILTESNAAKVLPASWSALREPVLAYNHAKEWTIVSLRRMRKFDKARIKVEEALAVAPDNVNFLCEKAFIYYSERNYDRAIEYFKRALELDEYDKFANQWLTASFRKRAGTAKRSEDAALDFARAGEALEAAKNKIPYASGIWEESAWLAFDQGNLEQAIRDIDQSIELDPYLIHKRFSKIEILARLNRWDDALDVFHKLKEEFPNDAEVAEQLCWFYLRLGERKLAADELKNLKKHHRGNILGVNAQGGYELDQRNYKEAEKKFREVIAHVDYEPQYYINLAWALVRQIRSPGELKRSEGGKPEKLIEDARKQCQKALKLDPYNSKAYACLGVIAYRRNSFLDAENHFRKSIELNPIEGSYVELAALYCQMGRFEDATRELKTALKINPYDARVHIELGNVSVLEENVNEAVRHCRQAIIVEPRNPEAHRALAVALMRAEKYEEAEIVIREAFQILAPTEPWRLYLLLAQVLIRTGDSDNKERKKKDPDLYQEALKYVNKAKQISPSEADVFFHEGIAYHRLEEYGASHRSFAWCCKLNRDRFEAERYGRVVQAVIDQQKQLLKVNTFFGHVMAAGCIVLLTVLWVQYFRGHPRTITAPSSTNTAAANATAPAPEPKPEFSVTPTLLTTMTPLLLGLLVVAALLPHLNKLKLPGGFEAVISEPKPPESNISTGPRGEIGFGSSLPIISPEPR